MSELPQRAKDPYTWTKDTPKKAGWYWYTHLYTPPRIIELPNLSANGEALYWDHGLSVPVAHWPGKWAGPIEVPL